MDDMYLTNNSDYSRPSMIEDVMMDVQMKGGDGLYYNLLGQPVMNPTKGFYILNGKKVVIK